MSLVGFNAERSGSAYVPMTTGVLCNEIDAGSLTKKSLLFEAVPPDFELRVGHKVGMVVYRTFDITKKDADLPTSSTVNLASSYGPKGRTCIYSGEVTEISPNG